MIEKRVKFNFKSYYEPTPANLRKLGDALLGASQFVAGYAVIADHKGLTIAFLIIGLVGKFMTNFFSEQPVVEESNEQNL